MNIFDHMRQQNTTWYTQHPFLAMSEADLTQLAAQAKLSVAELMQQALTPSVEMTCPLCGGVPSGPQPHLVSCKGCGGDAYGYEFEDAHRGPSGRDADGVSVFTHMRSALASALTGIATENQITHTIRHAFKYSGCLICPDCWRMTSTQWSAYSTCPLFILHETATHTPHTVCIGPILEGNFNPDAWRTQVRAYWAGTALRPNIAAWRNAILETALTDLEEQAAAIGSMVRGMIRGPLGDNE